MSAEIIDLAKVRSARTAAAVIISEPIASIDAGVQTTPDPQFQFWCGASGTRYVHSIYNLFECPPIPAGNYVLVKRTLDDVRTVVAIGRAAHETSSVNLAMIRQRSALLGANEVHVHLLAGSDTQSQLIEADLQALLVSA
jgi:hypothetical protein